MEGDDPIIDSIVKGYSIVTVIRILQCAIRFDNRTKFLAQPRHSVNLYDDYAVYICLRLWMVEYKLNGMDGLGNMKVKLYFTKLLIKII